MCIPTKAFSFFNTELSQLVRSQVNRRYITGLITRYIKETNYSFKGKKKRSINCWTQHGAENADEIQLENCCRWVVLQSNMKWHTDNLNQRVTKIIFTSFCWHQADCQHIGMNYLGELYSEVSVLSIRVVSLVETGLFSLHKTISETKHSPINIFTAISPYNMARGY